MLEMIGSAVRADVRDGSLVLFASLVGTGASPGSLCVARPVAATRDDWSGWEQIGAPGRQCASAPALALHDRLPMAVAGVDGAVWFTRRNPDGTAGASLWGSPRSLGRPGGRPVVSGHIGARPAVPTPALVVGRDGRLELFVVRDDQTVWHRSQDAHDHWDPWASLGRPGAGSVGPVIAKALQDGRILILTVDTDGEIWSRHQRAEGWSAWKAHGALESFGPVIDIAATRPAGQDALDVFAVHDNGVAHHHQPAPDQPWSPWKRLGAPSHQHIVQIAVGNRASPARRAVFALTSNQDTGAVDGVWEIEQKTDGTWTTWTDLHRHLDLVQSGPGELADPIVVQDRHQHLVLFLRMPNRLGLHRLYSPPAGGWTGDWENLEEPAAEA